MRARKVDTAARTYLAPPARPFAQELTTDPGSLRIALHTESFWGRATEPQQQAATTTSQGLRP